MPKKKKKDKGGGKGDAKLPPPPKFDETRQGALEALLSFKISDKERVISYYSDEADGYKDRNYQQQEKIYHLKQEQSGHLVTLLQEAHKYEKQFDEREVFTKEQVEEAQYDKIAYTRQAAKELKDIEEKINETDELIDKAQAEVKRLLDYKSEGQFHHAQLINEMKDKIADMMKEEDKLKQFLMVKLEEAKQDVDKTLELVCEAQREEISKKSYLALDSRAKAEISDNFWLKNQIATLEETLSQLQQNVDSLEQRNLRLMETVHAHQQRELEATQRLLMASSRRQQRPGSASNSSSTTQLPSLKGTQRRQINSGVKKPEGSSRSLDIGQLTVEGAKMGMKGIPDSFHLPPIKDSQSPRAQLPSSNWPVTVSMMKTIAL